MPDCRRHIERVRAAQSLSDAQLRGERQQLFIKRLPF